MKDENVVTLSKRNLEGLRTLAIKSLPIESCALLLGKREIWLYSIVEIMPMQNADNSRTSFSINPQGLLDAYDRAESRGHQVVGIFHSHPAEPAPSETDLKFMEINPVVWLIYSTITNEYKAYIFEDKLKVVRLQTTYDG